MTEERDAAVALSLITEHIKDCTQARIETKAQIKAVHDLLTQCLIGVLVTIVAAAGYLYTQNQALIMQQRQTQQVTVQAIEQSHNDTVKAIRETAK